MVVMVNCEWYLHYCSDSLLVSSHYTMPGPAWNTTTVEQELSVCLQQKDRTLQGRPLHRASCCIAVPIDKDTFSGKSGVLLYVSGVVAAASNVVKLRLRFGTSGNLIDTP